VPAFWPIGGNYAGAQVVSEPSIPCGAPAHHGVRDACVRTAHFRRSHAPFMPVFKQFTNTVKNWAVTISLMWNLGSSADHRGLFCTRCDGVCRRCRGAQCWDGESRLQGLDNAYLSTPWVHDIAEGVQLMGIAWFFVIILMVAIWIVLEVRV